MRETNILIDTRSSNHLKFTGMSWRYVYLGVIKMNSNVTECPFLVDIPLE